MILRLNLKLSICLLGLGFFAAPSVLGQSKPYQLPSSLSEDYKVEANYGAPVSVLNPLYPKDNRLSIAGGGAFSNISSLYDVYSGTASIIYHINQRHWIEPIWFAYMSSSFSNFISAEIRDKGKPLGTNATLSIEMPKMAIATSYIFSPFYAKMHMGYEAVSHFDVFFGGGPVWVKSDITFLDGNSTDTATAIGGNAVAGIRFLMGSRYGLRAELRDLIYNTKNLGEEELTHNLQLNAMLEILL